jgi:fused signal recognition particle receptor
MKFFRRKSQPGDPGSVAESPSADAPGADAPDADAPATPVATEAGDNAAAAPGETVPEDARPGFLTRLRRGLGRTSDNLVSGLGSLVLGRKEVDAALLEEIEAQLLMADVGIEATTRIVDSLAQRVSRSELVVGVNGVGKTTTIGKLAKQLQAEGNSVMLAAGDTFRAAAVEQLQTWGERNNVPVIAQHTGADPASVIFDALQAATARKVDVLIADTAGRLHTKTNLMEELKKIVRVMKKIDPDAPHEVMLVVDATTGQNALHQAVQFNEAVPLTGITVTKLDGTAKGGILFAIAERLEVPFRFIGVGEQIEDLRHFEADVFSMP